MDGEREAYIRQATVLCEAVLGITPELVPAFDMSIVDLDHRVQIRIDSNNAPKAMVKRYVQQMSESLFPPPMFTGDEVSPVPVDGNTRTTARLERGERYSEALIVPIKISEASEEQVRGLAYIGQRLNSRNGLPLETKEQHRMVENALFLGRSKSEIVGESGVDHKLVDQIEWEVKGKKRLRDLEVDEEQLRPAQIRAIGRAEDLADPVLGEISKLAIDAGLNVSEIQALAGAVRRMESESLAAERVSSEREANAIRIAERTRGGKGHPPAAAALRQRLGFVTARTPDVLVENNVEFQAVHLAELKSAVEILTETIRLQEEVIATAATAEAA